MVPMLFRTKLSIPEMDSSGTVIKTRKKVPVSRELVLGAAVFGFIPMGQLVTSRKGALAEYVVLPAKNMCLKPGPIPFDHAAKLPIAGISALALMDLAKLKPGYSLLVNTTSGGIRSIVV
jgi:NADPH:quinone reductase-like Zn-dependent oxidoreductase